jgi:ribonuclease Z
MMNGKAVHERISSTIPAPERWQDQELGPLDGSFGMSRGLSSVWLYVKSAGLLVDAGDGCATRLGSLVGAPHVIAITHGHGDHTHGLPAILAARQSRSLIQGGPVTVVYPEGCPGTEAVRAMLEAGWPGGMDRVTWRPIQAGVRVPIGRQKELLAFEVVHSRRMPSLGYAVLERRQRLNDHGRSLPKSEVQRIMALGEGSHLVESHDHALLVHGGDSQALDTPWARGADVLIHDCTFLSSDDRDDHTHAALDEVVEVALALEVKRLVLHHLSVRYPRPDALSVIKGAVGRLPARTWLWDDERLLAIERS